MIKSQKLKRIAKIVVPILKKNGVVKAGIFGSYARGEAKKRSDVDILIKQKGKKSLLDLVHLQFQLEDKLKKKVDLLDYSAIHRYVKEGILNEEVRIIS
jgi:predicted nucleotidyltransferase